MRFGHPGPHRLTGQEGAAIAVSDHVDLPGFIDYVRGTNIAGFKKVAEAMLAYGVV